MDRREVNHKWYNRFDEKEMGFFMTEEIHDEDWDLIEELKEAEESGDKFRNTKIPAIFEVCGTCNGKGKHVNPSIDSHGLSREDFDQDPDFEEDYFAGRYDIPCNECQGKRVSPVVDWDSMTEEHKTYVQDIIDDHNSYQAECEMERRMGC